MFLNYCINHIKIYLLKNIYKSCLQMDSIHQISSILIPPWNVIIFILFTVLVCSTGIAILCFAFRNVLHQLRYLPCNPYSQQNSNEEVEAAREVLLVRWKSVPKPKRLASKNYCLRSALLGKKKNIITCISGDSDKFLPSKIFMIEDLDRSKLSLSMINTNSKAIKKISINSKNFMLKMVRNMEIIPVSEMHLIAARGKLGVSKRLKC